MLEEELERKKKGGKKRKEAEWTGRSETENAADLLLLLSSSFLQTKRAKARF